MKILIAVEDKLFAEAIGEFTKNHHWPDNTEFRIIHVVEPLYLGAISGYPSDLLTSYVEERHRAGKALVLSVGSLLRENLPKAPIWEEVIDGYPKESIIDTAAHWHADLIIVGSHGRSGIGRFLLGSVSMAVLSAAPCSVMVIKLPKLENADSERQQEALSTK